MGWGDKVLKSASIFTSVKMWLIITAFTSVVSGAAYFIHNYKTMALQNEVLTTNITEKEIELEDCKGAKTAQQEQFVLQNARIAILNAQSREKLLAAELQMKAMEFAIKAHIDTTRRLKEQLSRVHRYARQAVENDQEFADWSATTAPDATWSLLREAREGVYTD
jgi:hypothetical protein